MTTLLVTSAGSGVSAAIADACRATGWLIHLIGLSTTPQAARAAGYNDVRVSPATADHCAFQEFVLEQVRLSAGGLVVAGRDDDVMALAPIADRIQATGGRWTGVIAELGRWAQDKLQVAQRLRVAGLPVAETVPASDAHVLARRYGYPLVVKPRYGNGSRGVQLASDEAQLRAALHNASDVVAQPYLRSWNSRLPATGVLDQRDELSLQLVIGERRTAGAFATRNLLHQGRPVEAVATFDPELQELGRKVVDALRNMGARGPLNVQAKETAPHRFEIFELNFRCTGLTGVRAAMGFNEIGALLGSWPDDDAAQEAAMRRWVAHRADPAQHGFVLSVTGRPCIWHEQVRGASRS